MFELIVNETGAHADNCRADGGIPQSGLPYFLTPLGGKLMDFPIRFGGGHPTRG